MPEWLKKTEKLVIWDDHDYGLNDAGANYIYKVQSQQIYNDAWNIDQNDPRRSREGIYFSELKDIQGKKVLFIGLDTRYFRSNLIKVGNAYKPNKNTNTTVLGAIQWKWLEKEISQDHDILILGSSIQVLPTEHRFEKWSNFPHERNKLLELLSKLTSNVLIISGDRHRSGFYKQDNIYEFTSSSLNRGIFPSYETDSLLIGKTYTQNNYGIVEFYEDSLNLFIKDENMKILESLEIPLKELVFKPCKQYNKSHMSKPTREQAEKAVKTLIEWAGDDPTREGLIETPKRVVKAYEQFFEGYDLDPEEILRKTFEEVEGYDEMVIVKDIRLESHCEHHIVPILGKAHIGYIPNNRVVGISKLARIVDVFGKRLQTQETMTSQIANVIQKVLDPKGVAVVIDASHQCMTTRGVHKPESSTVTSAMKGIFKENAVTRNEFLSFVTLPKK